MFSSPLPIRMNPGLQAREQVFCANPGRVGIHTSHHRPGPCLTVALCADERRWDSPDVCRSTPSMTMGNGGTPRRGPSAPGALIEKAPTLRGFSPCAREDSNLHGPISPQGPQPCASTNSATGAWAASIALSPCRPRPRSAALAWGPSVSRARFTNTRSTAADRRLTRQREQTRWI